MRKISSIIKPLIDFSAFIFPFSIIFYLFLFLLENVFIGFVSNIFDLNYFLIPILAFGFFALFFEEKRSHGREIENSKLNDFFLITFMIIFSFMLLLYKTRDIGKTGLLISVSGSLLVALIVIVTRLFSEEKENLTIIDGAKSESARDLAISNFFLSRVTIIITIVITIALAAGIYFYLIQPKKAAEVVAINNAPIPIPTPTIIPPDINLLTKTQIIIANASGKRGVATALADFLKQKKFGNVKTGTSPVIEKDIVIRFNDKDATVAAYLSVLLTKDYNIINLLPMQGSQSGIMVTLGSQNK